MKTSSKILIIVFIGLVLCIFSCRKDPVIPEPEPPIQPTPVPLPDNCPETYMLRTEPYDTGIYKGNEEPPCMFLPTAISSQNYNYMHHVVNPNNPYEFAFLKRGVDLTGSGYDLCIYNFCKNTVKTIANDVFYSPDWSVKNWIIFTGLDLQLWKIKSNGDSLTKLTNTGNYNNHAKWSPDGTQYLYQDPNVGMRISNSDGTFNKLVYEFMDNWVWLNNDEIIFSTYTSGGVISLNKYDINTEAISLLATIPGSSILSFDIKNNIVYFNLSSGVYEINNGFVNLIDSSYYTYKSITVQALTSDYILVDRIINDTIDYASCIVHGKRYLSLLNKHTKEERYIKIPE